MLSAVPSAAGRPSWSGLLRLSLVAVPVKAYPAVRACATHFNQLHAGCGQRIRHQKCCPQHGPVDAAAIVRGYPYGPDQYVVVEPEELDRLRPARDRALVLEQCVHVPDIDPVFFAGRSLYLFPDGVAAQHPYGVVSQALSQGRQGALGRVVLAGQRQLVLVRPAAGLLVLDVLHYPAQIRSAPTPPAAPCGGPAVAEELRLARQLVEAASSPLDWSRYPDTTAAELAALLEAKIAQQPLPAPATASAALVPLLDALKQSVADLQQRPSAARPQPGRGPRRAQT